jgi:hypothetical protein
VKWAGDFRPLGSPKQRTGSVETGVECTKARCLQAFLQVLRRFRRDRTPTFPIEKRPLKCRGNFRTITPNLRSETFLQGANYRYTPVSKFLSLGVRIGSRLLNRRQVTCIERAATDYIAVRPQGKLSPYFSRPKGSSTEWAGCVNHRAPVSVDDHVVLQAYTEFAVDADRWLTREGHSGLQHGLVALHKIGPFVHVQTNAVASAMREARGRIAWPETGAVNDGAGSDVNILASIAGFCGGRALPGPMPRLLAQVRSSPGSRLNSDVARLPKWADSVAKVVLPKVSKILRAAGAIFV